MQVVRVGVGMRLLPSPLSSAAAFIVAAALSCAFAPAALAGAPDLGGSDAIGVREDVAANVPSEDGGIAGAEEGEGKWTAWLQVGPGIVSRDSEGMRRARIEAARERSARGVFAREAAQPFSTAGSVLSCVAAGGAIGSALLSARAIRSNTEEGGTPHARRGR